MRVLFRTLALLAIVSLTTFSYAGDHTQKKGGDPHAKLNDRIKGNNFAVGRTLGHYTAILGPDFLKHLTSLTADQHWVDLGSGEGIAIENYFQHKQGESPEALQRSENRLLYYGKAAGSEFLKDVGSRPVEARAKVTGITFTLNRPHPSTRGGKFRILSGRYFEDIPSKSIGKADLITDVFGVLAYTPKLDVALEKAINLLNRGGKIYFLYNLLGTSDNRIRMPDDRSLTIPQWLETIPGIRTSVVRFEGQDTIRIERVADTVVVPRLELLSSDDEPPPNRQFRQIR